jgi:hypothetical protein
MIIIEYHRAYLMTMAVNVIANKASPVIFIQSLEFYPFEKRAFLIYFILIGN